MVANIHSLVFVIFKILLLKSAVRLEAATSVNQTQKITTTPSTGPATIIFVTRPLPSYIYPGTSSLNEQNSALDPLKATYSSDNTTFANKYSSPALYENVNPLSTDTVLQSSPSTQQFQKTVMRRSSELVVTRASSSSSNQRLTKSSTQAEYKGMNITILQKSKPRQVTTFAVSSVYTKTQATKSSSESAETKKGAINPSSLPTFLSTVFVSSLPRTTQTEKVVDSERKASTEAVFSTKTPSHSVRNTVETELLYSTKATVEFQAESSSILSTSSSPDKQNDNSPSMPVTEEGKANTTVFAYYVSPSEASTILRSPFNEITAETENHYSEEKIQGRSSFHSTFSGSFLYKTKLIEKSSFISSTSDSEAKTTVFGNVLPRVTVTSVVSHSIKKTVDVKLIHSTPKINDSDTIHVAYPFSSIDMKNVAKSSITKTKVIQESSYTVTSNKVFTNVFPSLIAINLTSQYVQKTSKAEMLYPSNEIKVSTSFLSTYSASSLLKTDKRDESSSIPTETKESDEDKTIVPSYIFSSVVATNLTSRSVQKTPKAEIPHSTNEIKVSTSFLSTYSTSLLQQTEKINESSSIPTIRESTANKTIPLNVRPSVVAKNLTSKFVQEIPKAETPYSTKEIKVTTSFVPTYSTPSLQKTEGLDESSSIPATRESNANKTIFLQKTEQIHESSSIPATKESDANKTIFPPNILPSRVAKNLTSKSVQITPKAETPKEIKVTTSFSPTYSSTSSLQKTRQLNESSSIPTTMESNANKTIFPDVLASVVATNLTSKLVQQTPKAEAPHSTKEIKVSTSFLSTYSASLLQTKQIEESSFISATRESIANKTIFPPNVLPSVVATNLTSQSVQKTPTAETLYSTKEIKVSTSFLSTYSVALLQQTEHINESSSIIPSLVATNLTSQSIQETPTAEAPYSTTKEIKVSTSFSSTYFAPSLQKTEQINESSSVSATIGESNPDDLPRVVATNLTSQSIQKTPKAEIPYSTIEIKVTTTFLPTYSVSSVEQTKQIDKPPSIAASRTNMTDLSTLITTNRSSTFIQKTALPEKPYSISSLLTNSTLSLHKAKQTGETSSFSVSREITENVTVFASALPSMDVATSTLSHFIHTTPSSSSEWKASGTFNSTHSVDSLRKTKEIKKLSSIIVTHERKTNRTALPNVLPTTVARNKSSRSVQKTVIEIPQSTIEEIKESRTSISTYSSSSSQQPKELEESSTIPLSRPSITNMTEVPNALPSVVATNTIIETSYTSKKIKESTIFLSPYSVSSLSKAKQIEESRSIPASEEIGKANMTVSATVVPEVVATSTIPRSVQTKTETPYSTKDIEEATESFHSTYSISTVQETKDITKLYSIAEKSIVSTTSNVSQSIQKTTEITYATEQIEKSSVFLTASSSSLYKAKDIKESSSIYVQMETKTLTVFASFSPRVVATNTTFHKVQKTAYLKTEVTYSRKEIKTSAMLPLPESTTKFQTTQTVVPTTPDDTKIIVQEFRMIFKITSALFTNELARHTSKEFKEKSHEIEQKLNDIYKNMPEYSYSKVLRFFEGSLGCEVSIFLESKDTNPVQEQTVKDVLLREKDNGVFGDFVDLDVKEVKPGEKEKETKTWGRWPVVVVSILGGICLVLLVVVITQCIQKRHYSHSIEEYSAFPDTPASIQLKVSKNHDYSDEERIPMNTFHPDISLV